jgi:hypothetical protein
VLVEEEGNLPPNGQANDLILAYWWFSMSEFGAPSERCHAAVTTDFHKSLHATLFLRHKKGIPRVPEVLQSSD